MARTYKSYLWTHPKTRHKYARVQIKQPNGKYKTILRRAKNKTHADQLAREIKAEFGNRGQAYVEGEAMSFEELAKWYAEQYLFPPVYNKEGVKVAGLVTFRAERNKLKRICRYFSDIKIKDITEETLHYFKSKRLKSGITVATANRDLELLRAMFKKAVRRRWLKENPFDFGERLIEKALEERRRVTLTPEQESKLLKAAQKHDSLVYYVILMLRDTGARPSELYRVGGTKRAEVTWSDLFEFDFKVCRLTSMKSKQTVSRFAPVTQRLKTALMELWMSLKDKDKEAYIFPVTTFKTVWGQIRKEIAENENDAFYLDVRLRDLRRDFRSRLGRLGYSDQMAQRLLGHKSAETTFIYTEADLAAVKLAGDILDKDIAANESQ